MASIFKQQYTSKDRQGRSIKKKSQHWYVDYKTSDGTRKRVKGFKDKAATAQLAAKLEKEAELAQAGIIDPFKEHRQRPLSEHLDDFKASLIAKGNTLKHAEQQTKRVWTVLDRCHFRLWQDISASKTQKAISTLRKSVEVVEIEKINGRMVRNKRMKDLGLMAAKTQGYYLKAVQQFCRWMVQDARVPESPLEHLKAKKSVSEKRRALDANEIRLLLEKTERSENRYGMSGADRAMLYQLAVETGLRVSEIKSLRSESFDFDNNCVIVQAAYTKNRTEAILPLRDETAMMFKDFLKTKMPNASAFDMPHTSNFAKMLRRDLQDAGIDTTNNEAGKLDFHSLRHTFGTMLAASGVHPKTAQDLMRHSDINLTMSRYTHTLRGQTAKAVASLPDFSTPSEQAQAAKATGTSGRDPETAYKPAYKKLTKKPDSDRSPMASIGSTKGEKSQNPDSPKSLNMAPLGKKKGQMSPSDLDCTRQESNL